MKMENVANLEDAKTLYSKQPRESLIGQQIGMRASIHALDFLISNRSEGVTPEILVDSLRHQLHALHEVAHARGIELLSYEGQG